MTPTPSGRRPAEPTRIAAARLRASAGKRRLALAAAGSFLLALALVRASHPAATTAGPALSTPASLAAEVGSGLLGGGSIAPAAGPPAVSTAAS